MKLQRPPDLGSPEYFSAARLLDPQIDVRDFRAKVDTFEDDNGHLTVQIDTDRLTLLAAMDSPEQRSSFCGLYCIGSAESRL